MNASGIVCPNCGGENRPRDLFCTRCGARLTAASPPQIPSEPPMTAARRASPRRSNLLLRLTMGAILVLLILVATEGVMILMPRGAVREVGATLSVVEGKVFVQTGGEGDWIQVDEDLVVQAGDRIRVTGASQGLLTVVENTSTEIRAFTELTISELEMVEGEPVVVNLALEVGEIWNRIGDLPAGSLHEVTTAAASAVCRGSEYGVAANEAGTTWLTGHEGEIQVIGAGQTFQLGAGEMLVVEPGSPPEPYQGAVAAAPFDGPECCSPESIDLGSFGNRPVPTRTPTATRDATHTPTATSTATPTATATRRSCPTLTINTPHTARPYGVFGMEWDATGAPVPGGWEFALEFSQDPSPQAAWQRAQPDRIYQEGGHWKAELHGPGAGHWYWRVCLVSEPGGPSQCCGEPHMIMHQRDGEPEPPREPEEPEPSPYAY